MSMDNDGEKQTHEQKDEVLEQRSWEAWRELSLKPGGFGEERISAWSILAHAIATSTEGKSIEPLRSTLRHRKSPVAYESDPSVAHPDEHQIKLDTDRSFVLYPSEEQRDRVELQSDLNGLITSIFRRHPQLNYFQGYHDIVTVVYLTLPERRRLQVCEKLSLHRLRDAMGKGLEPVIALLRILKYLLRLADKQFSELVDRNMPLPYFALSNLLTLFSHDVPTLPLIQHFFDYLLCRPPIISVYLAAAITLTHKDEAQLLEEEGEEGMIHSLLSSLPELVDETPKPSTSRQPENLVTLVTNSVREDVSLDEDISARATPTDKLAEDIEASEPTVEMPAATLCREVEQEKIVLGYSEMDRSLDNGEIDVENSNDHATPTKSQLRPKRKAINLSQILERSDELFTRYPPSHPALHLSSILGPQSVVFTWSEDETKLLSDEEAESIVSHPELVVLPFEDPDEVVLREGRKERKPVPFQQEPRLDRRLLSNSKTMLLTGVAVAGIAVAVYSMKSRGSRGKIDDWKKAGQWLAEIVNLQVYPF